MQYTITSKFLKLTVSLLGAEIQSIKRGGHEYIWQGDSAWWNRKAPVLFPLVGGLPEGSIKIGGKPYSISKHGFARDCEFALANQSESKLTLKLTVNDSTKRQYPFDFGLITEYEVHENEVSVRRTVVNNGETPMPFVIGEHPGFFCPMEEGLTFEDYILTFEADEKGVTRRIDGKGLLKDIEEPVFTGTQLPLKPSLFDDDALIFSHLASKSVLLSSAKGSRSVRVSWQGYDYLGVWAPKAKDGIAPPFVCIEPWTGVNSRPGDINYEEKEGIITLQPGESRSFSMVFRFE